MSVQIRRGGASIVRLSTYAGARWRCRSILFQKPLR
jgi:hypothetical protein